MKRIGLIGSFGLGEALTDGQNVKSNNVYNALLAIYPKDEIVILDTHSHSKKLFKILFGTIKILFQCSNIIIMPAQNGVRVFVPLLSVLNFFCRKSLHYVVIGAWLGECINKNPNLLRSLKKFKGIYPETSSLSKELNALGLTNTFVFPNFKELPILSPEALQDTYEKPYKLCTFSRVMRKKGITDAIEALRTINEEAGQTVYCLDIYGKIDEAYQTEFSALLEQTKGFVRYMGVASPEKSVEIIQNYFLLLFPTKFETEGIPGTIIDAYASGVPVLAARWKSYADVVEERETGFGYEQNNQAALLEMLRHLAEHPELVTGIKENCLRKAVEFTPQATVKILVENLSV